MFYTSQVVQDFFHQHSKGFIPNTNFFLTFQGVGCFGRSDFHKITIRPDAHKPDVLGLDRIVGMSQNHFDLFHKGQMEIQDILKIISHETFLFGANADSSDSRFRNNNQDKIMGFWKVYVDQQTVLYV